MTPDDVVEARSLVVRYRTPRGPVVAVNGVDLDLRRGETLALVGESGCGKSTLGRALMGFLPRGSNATGTVRFGGRDLLALAPRERRSVLGREIAMIFQDPATRLDPLMTIEAHFAEVLRSHGVRLTREAARERAARALAEVGVPASRLDNHPHEASGGQRQRIMIALGLVLDPSVLVADEPTTSLDVIVEAQIMRVLDRLKRDRGMSVLLVTHNLGLVAEVADRVAVMYAGDIVEVASVNDAFERPAHPYTQGLLASSIHLGTERLHSVPGAPPDLATPPSGCRFHPRCPRARALCRDARPPWAEVDGSRALCWFPGPDGDVRPQASEADGGPPLAPATADRTEGVEAHGG